MRLSDCFMELIAYTAFMVRDVARTQLTYDEVRGTVQRLISQSEAAGQVGQIAQEDFQIARFAVFAWIDEAILASTWEGRYQWQREQLQRQYYQTADAGELFYDRLNSIGPHQRDVREVYYICLALGFTGQYCHAGDDYMLGQLRNANLKLLTGSSVNLPDLVEKVLFPEAYPSEDAEGAGRLKRRRWSTMHLVAAAAPVVLFGVIYLVYYFILGNIGRNLMGTVP